MAERLPDPAIAPKGGPPLLRSSRGALAAIAPPLGLLGLIETGPGKDTDCGRGVPLDRKEPETGLESLTPPSKPGKAT